MPSITHNYPFDPTYGYSLEQMLALEAPQEPDGFVPFWQETYNQAMGVPLDLEIEEQTPRQAGFRMRLVHYRSMGGVRIGALLVEPAEGPIERFIVSGHGYGSDVPAGIWHKPKAAVLFIACRGMSLSAAPGMPSLTPFHVLHGIESKETYIHRGCVADTWGGVSAMEALFPQSRGKVFYNGGSFGGGIGAMALAWDKRIIGGKLGVPSFGNWPVRLKCHGVGSGEAVRLRYERDPSIFESTLRYHDSAIHARHITVPVFADCALFDPAVAPPGQFTVYNAIPTPKDIYVRTAGHHDWPTNAPDDRGIEEKSNAFITAHHLF